jgi:hypothetical protein
MRVYNSRIKAQESERAQSPFGVGLLVGALAVRAAWDVGCRKAELLAIKDNDLWHAKLVRSLAKKRERDGVAHRTKHHSHRPTDTRLEKADRNELTGSDTLREHAARAGCKHGALGGAQHNWYRFSAKDP